MSSKVTGTVFWWREDANNYNNIFRPFWGSKSLFFSQNGNLEAQIESKCLISDFNLRMIIIIFEIICILMAAKNHNSKLADTHFAPDYCIS